MPAAVTTKRQLSRKTPGKAATKGPSVSPDQLAKQLAATLVVSDPKGKRKADITLSDEEKRANSMRSVNTASQHFSSLVKTGWKSSSDTKSTTFKSATESALSAANHLEILRRMKQDDLDIERAAISVLGKLVALDLYDHALRALKALHPRMCLFTGSTEQQTNSSNHLLSLPIPPEPPQNDITLNLVSNYLINAIIILSHYATNTSRSSTAQPGLPFHSFCSSLVSTSTLLTWMPSLSALPAKYLDSILTRGYSVINKLAQSNLKEAPETLFHIRTYAIKCLAYTSQGTISPDSLWNQTTKFSAEYIKTQISNKSASESESARVVLASYSDIISVTEKRADRNVMMSGQGFLRFCESWTSFANRAGDLESLDRIGALMHSAAMPILASRQPSDIPTTRDLRSEEVRPSDVEITNIYTNLARISTALSQEIGNIDDSGISRLQEWTFRIKESSIVDVLSQSYQDKDTERIAGKIQRALEKCRRSAIKTLDGDCRDNSSFVNATRKLGDTVVEVLEQVLRKGLRAEFINQALDTLFVLARTTILIPDPRTYTSAYEYLDRAVTILDMVDNDNPNSQSLDPSNYARCTSGAFHNLAGTLFQASRYGSAISFLKESCRLGMKAMELHRLCNRAEEERDQSKKDPWRQLEEQLWRRWQLLALCYTKIGERKPAFDALLRCIETFPYIESTFGDRVNRTSMSSLFDFSPVVKELAGIVDRVSYMGACELLLAVEEFSLRRAQVDFPGVKGALLERQLETLDAHRHKEGMIMTIPSLMKDAVDEYKERNMPVRRARVFVRALSFAYFTGADTTKNLGTVKDIGQQVLRVFDSPDMGQDQQLIHFIPEYRASLHLWMSLHAHCLSTPQQSSLTVGSHAEEACRLLQPLVSPASPSTSAGKAGKASSSKKPSVRQPKPSKTRAKAPITPKPRNHGEALQDLPVNAVSTSPRDHVAHMPEQLDSLSKLMDALQLCAHVLGLLALNLQKIRMLDIARKLSERFVGMASEGYIVSSSSLAREYLLLGKFHRAKKVFELTQSAVQQNICSEHCAITFFLNFAELCAFIGDVPRGAELYAEANKIASRVVDDQQSSFHKAQARIMRIERIAMAGNVLATVSSAQNDTVVSLKWLLHSLRLWNRAWEFLTRLQPTTSRAPKSVEDSNPFEVASLRDALPVVTPQTLETKKVYTRKSSMSGLEWRISQGLLQTMFTLGQVYLARGSSREAQYFFEQARDLADAINSPAFLCRAIARLEEIQMHEGRLTDPERLEELDILLGRETCVDVADIHRLKGDLEQRIANIEDAQGHYGAALRTLEEFDGLFGKLDGVEFGPRYSLGSNPGNDLLTPTLLIRILKEHIWLLRDDDSDRFDELLNRFLAIPPSLQSQAEKDALMAKLTLHDVYRRSRIDMFLSSIGETAVALPMGTSSTFAASLSPSLQDVLRSLENAEQLFWSQLLAHGDTGYVPDVRAAIVCIALIRSFQASLGRSELASSRLMAGLLDASAAVTLRREMLEVISLKFPLLVPQDDLSWPTIGSDGALIHRPPHKRQLRLDSSDDEDEDSDSEESSLTEYWESVRQRYRSFVLNEETLSCPLAHIPPHWTVVHITVTDDRKTLFVSRQRGSSGAKDHPLMFCIPLQGRREGSDDDSEQQLTFEAVIEEFNEIIRLSNETTKVAASIREDQSARAKWWKDRGALDTRLQDLLDNIEFCWLGAFKTILSKNTHLSQEGIANLRIQFDRVFQQGLRLQDKKTKEKALGHGKAPSESWGPNRVTLDDALVECFSTLSPECRDEELEDLVYFVLDLYQFHGVPVAIAEIDVDQVVVDLRTVLQEHTAKSKPSTQPRRPGAFGHQSSTAAPGNEDEHLFLVLDKNVQGLPWESIPALRGRSVSRIPSISFLLDRLHFSRWRREHDQSSTATGKMKSSVSETMDRAVVDPRRGYYIINPSGDLRRTEERFKPWLKEMESVGWEGVSGRAPTELEMLRALEQNDLVVYFGHGGAEQYVRSHKIRHLRKCAVVMLWGCSSGYLKDMGDFDRVGTPLNYMLAGCPTLVANLWDVTDKDIDAFSQSVFDKLNMNADNLRGKRKADKRHKETSVVEAVAQSRSVCKLKYLTGAAPVVYGIPYYL